MAAAVAIGLAKMRSYSETFSGEAGERTQGGCQASRPHHLKELVARMGVSYGYLPMVATGSRPWIPMLRERAVAVLGWVPQPLPKPSRH